RATIEDTRSAKRRPALDHQTTPRRRHPRRPRQEQTCQGVGGAKSDRQVHPDHDEMRKLDRRFDGNQHAIRSVLSLQTKIDLAAAGEAPAIHYLLPMT